MHRDKERERVHRDKERERVLTRIHAFQPALSWNSTFFLFLSTKTSPDGAFTFRAFTFRKNRVVDMWTLPAPGDLWPYSGTIFLVL